jgi:hypothetical protein
MISIDIMISATKHHPPLTAHYSPLAACLMVPATCNSASVWIKHTGAYMGAYTQVILGVSCHLRVYKRL